MNRLFDLRFVIGAFFSVAGVLLLLYSLLTNSPEPQDVNRWCGALFIIFGIVMIVFSLTSKQPADVPDEL
jgi:uncharacterized membrane protein HdeD (DUF308 family)